RRTPRRRSSGAGWWTLCSGSESRSPIPGPLSKRPCDATVRQCIFSRRETFTSRWRDTSCSPGCLPTRSGRSWLIESRPISAERQSEQGIDERRGRLAPENDQYREEQCQCQRDDPIDLVLPREPEKGGEQLLGLEPLVHGTLLAEL